MTYRRSTLPGMSKPPRIRRFPGSQIWALAQDAYLQGEPAASIADRLDLTVNGIRKRAVRKGWTRTQAEAARQRNAHPHQALNTLLDEVGRAAAEGRLETVLSLLTGAERLTRVAAAAPRPPLEPSPEIQARWREAETRRLETQWGERALRMAQALLSDRGYDLADNWSLEALRWRARVLGPDQARRDFLRGVRGGWAGRYWDEAGVWLPPDEGEQPEARMWRQHRGGGA